MFSPSSRTSPSSRVPSIRSFMRLSTRRNVDLPQPEGPIRASTERSGIGSVILKSAWRSPYQKLRSRTSNFAFTALGAAGCRPVSVRSVMIAEYERVDKAHLNQFDSPRGGRGILKTEYVERVKKAG